MEIGRRIYFDKLTGLPLADTGERSGAVRATTVEEDIIAYKVLSERNRGSFDYVELEYGEYFDNFIECSSYYVDVNTKELTFLYKNDTTFTPPPPTIEEQVLAELHYQTALLEMQTLGGNE